MIPHQRIYAGYQFRAMVGEAVGNEFEKLFHRLMELCHPDFVAVRTHGNVGDLGADGLSLHDRKLYACYGPERPDAYEVGRKFRADVASAVRQRSGQFDTFVFVHNDDRGINPHLSGHLPAAASAYPHLKFELMGPRRLWRKAKGLDLLSMEELLGVEIPVEPLVLGIAMTDLEPLLRYLGENHRVPAPERPILIPSQYKMDYNRLSDDARHRFALGHPRLHLVDMYYQRTLDSTERDEVAEGFREAYREARERHGDDSDEILYALEGYIVGNRRPTRKDEAAAWTVLAYFFGACDIFEVPPDDWTPSGGRA